MKFRSTTFKRSAQISISIFVSKFFGFFRDVLLVRFLGIGFLSDAFRTAFHLPNLIRRIFSEGALQASLSPVLMKLSREEGTKKANELLTLVLIGSKFVAILFCLFAWHFSDLIIWILAPGLACASKICAARILRIFVFSVIFYLGGAIFGSLLVSIRRFRVPANIQTLVNLLVILQLLICLRLGLGVIAYAYFLLFNSVILFLVHLLDSFQIGFRFVFPTRKVFRYFFAVFRKFLPSALAVGSMEIGFLIDRIMVSYLPVGSISLFPMAATILRIPVGIFASAFAFVLLPDMTQLALYAPRRLSFYLHETLKLFLWVVIPISILMAIFSQRFFYTFYFSAKFPMDKVYLLSKLLVIFCLFLFFFSINKVLINLYYSLRDTARPALFALLGAFLNTVLNLFFIKFWGIFGVALATGISVLFQSILLFTFLHKSYGIKIYFGRLADFLLKMLIQLFFSVVLFYILYFFISEFIFSLSVNWMRFFWGRFGFWLWVVPLSLCVAFFMFATRRIFGLKFYFLPSKSGLFLV